MEAGAGQAAVLPSRGWDNWAVDIWTPDAGDERGSCCKSRRNFKKTGQASKDCDAGRSGLQKTGRELDQEPGTCRVGAARDVNTARGRCQEGAAPRQHEKARGGLGRAGQQGAGLQRWAKVWDAKSRTRGAGGKSKHTVRLAGRAWKGGKQGASEEGARLVMHCWARRGRKLGVPMCRFEG